MGLISEFKEFAVKGNVVDLAVGIIIGAAFGKIVSSMVGDIIMPLVGFLTGGVDFSKAGYVLRAADAAATPPVEEVVLRWGAFVQVTIDFIIVAFAIFMMVKLMNSMKRQEEEAPAEPPREEVLLEEIRDLLRQQK